MASLSRHLRLTEGHARLAFHPECPICRAERLSGMLATEQLLGRRTRAAVVAGVLAMATPAVALAQEPDQVNEGTIVPEQAGHDPALDPDFDPGGESEVLPFDEPETPGPLEQEPATEVEPPVADAGDEASEPQTAAPSPVATVTPVPSPTPAPAVEAEPADQPAPEPADEQTPPPAQPGSNGKARRRPAAHDRDDTPPAVAPAEPVAPPATAPVEPIAPPPSTPSAAVATSGSAKPGDRFHVVRPGESLWSIARDVIGDNASPARTAREVNRLWELNSARIATGDPDLLRIGTRLALR